MARKADIVSQNHGTVWTFTGNTRRGTAWLKRANDEYAGQIISDHRYGFDIAVGALSAGLHLQDAATGRFATLPTED